MKTNICYLAMVLFVLVVFVNLSTSADIPQTISFQGKLLESGQPVTDTKDLLFTIPGTGWSEEVTGVNIVNGLYSVVLNIPFSIINNTSSAQLQVSIDGSVLSPNTEISSVPYSYKSEVSIDTQKIAGTPVLGVPSSNQILTFDGVSWIPSDFGSVNENDPVFTGSPVASIIDSDISHWNSAYGWGDHGQAGYLEEEVDPTVPSWLKDGLSWSEIDGRPQNLIDGDQSGITSLNGIENEGGNINLVGNGITITQNDSTKEIVLTASGGNGFDAGYAVIAQGNDYSITISHSLGEIPKIVEVTFSFSTDAFSQAKWIDTDQDGLGVVTILHTNQSTGMVRSHILDSSDKIGRCQTGTSDAQDFRIQTTDSSITISKGDIYGSPTLQNIIPLTWNVQ